jgi:large subunit ribosomal protein L6
MSRVGRKEIPIPQGVTVELSDRSVKVKGPKGELVYRLLPGIDLEQEKSVVRVTQQSTDKNASAFWGLSRALINNMIVGVSRGYQRALELRGTGYRAEVSGATLKLHLGYSHPIEYALPKGIATKIDGQKIMFESPDKQLLGQVAAVVRSFRPPEPYNGTGVRYLNEQVRTKAGKTAGA